MAEKQFSISGNNFLGGYYSDPLFRKPTELAPPSMNVRITTSGSAETRPGYENTGINLSVTGYPATSFYMDLWDIAFFAIGTKLYYADYNQLVNQLPTIIDTGITLTAGTTTRFSEYAGDLFLTNTTDGLKHIIITRLAAAVTSGDGYITIEQEGAGKLFPAGYRLASGNLRINGTNEAYTVSALTGTIFGGSVTNITNNGSGLVRITYSGSPKLQTGQRVTVVPVAGSTGADGTWTITRIDSTHFDLQTSTIGTPSGAGGYFQTYPTGAIPLDTTASQNYTNGTIVIITGDSASFLPTIPKGSKLTFWKERMCIMGVSSDTSVAAHSANIYFSKFTTLSSGTYLSDIEYFSLDGVRGSETELVGKSGKITNIVPTKNYLYVLKQSELYSISPSDVNTSTGASPPLLVTDNYGCINEDCACEMNGDLVWITQNKRVMKTTFQVFSTGSVAVPDETFDLPIRNLLQYMDDTQVNPHVWYHKGKKLLYCQITVQQQQITLVFDNNIGKWLPPDDNKVFKSYFERKGTLFATDLYNKNVYELDSTPDDNGQPINCVVATGIFQYVEGRVTCEWDEVDVGGLITQPTVVSIECFVDDQASPIKTVNGNEFDYAPGSPIGAPLSFLIGGVLPQFTQTTANWAQRFDLFPHTGNQIQIITSCFGAGNFYSVSSYRIAARAYSESILSLT